MKRQKPWLVTEGDTRGRQRGDRCFYCPAEFGKEHAADCVVRQRTVVMRMTVEFVIDQVEDWTGEQIARRANMGSGCASNFVRMLGEDTNEEMPDGSGCFCFCPNAKFEFVREATLDDHERYAPPLRRARLLLDDDETKALGAEEVESVE